jgi:hypothetical protein
MDRIKVKMIRLSNNSRLTQEAAILVSEELSESDRLTVERWLDLALRERDYAIARAKKRYRGF